MGYSASLTDGDEIVIPDGARFWRDLVDAATSRSIPMPRQFSWTHTVDEYLERVGDSDAQHAADMMEDYGFDAVRVEDDAIILECWGGDKLGSSWNEIWDVIAVHAEPYRWVMAGEDGAIWCEDNPNQSRRVRDLDIDLSFPA